MEAMLAAAIGVLSGCGFYMLLRPRIFVVMMGLVLLSHAVNLFLFASGGIGERQPPLLGREVVGHEAYADPLSQALVLTAIVIGFAMTAFLMVLAVRARMESGSDHTDGTEREPKC